MKISSAADLGAQAGMPVLLNTTAYLFAESKPRHGRNVRVADPVSSHPVSSENHRSSPEQTPSPDAPVFHRPAKPYSTHLPSREHIAGESSGPCVNCLALPPVASMRQIAMRLVESCDGAEYKMYRPWSQEIGDNAAVTLWISDVRLFPSASMRKMPFSCSSSNLSSGVQLKLVTAGRLLIVTGVLAPLVGSYRKKTDRCADPDLFREFVPGTYTLPSRRLPPGLVYTESESSVMCDMLPIVSPTLAVPERLATSFAKPKSRIFPWPRCVTNRLAGLISR